MISLTHSLHYRRLKNLRYRLRRSATAYLKLIQASRITEYTLPDFLIIGAMKSGTTSLYYLLQQHPGICAASTKEVGFLDRPEYYRFGERWYGAYFPRPAAMRTLSARLGYRAITGEASPGMIRHCYAINAARHVPDAKLIAVLRNPVDRAYSHYQHICRSISPDPLSFWDALQAEPERVGRDLELNLRQPEQAGANLTRLAYTERGKYIHQILRWLQYFPREQLKLVSYDQFQADPASVCNAIVEFLELPPHPFVAAPTLNKGHYSTTMDERCRDYLTALYRPYNRRLFEFLGEDWGWPS